MLLRKIEKSRIAFDLPVPREFADRVCRQNPAHAMIRFQTSGEPRRNHKIGRKQKRVRKARRAFSWPMPVSATFT